MRPIAIALFAAVLVACAGSAPERNLYLLRSASTDASGRIEAPVRVGLGSILVAPYLDQAGIVVETEAGQVHAAREHRWAEPLDAGLRSYLRAEISGALGFAVSTSQAGGPPWDFTVNVYVDRLHGTMEGAAVLDAGYRITPRAGSGGAVEYRFSQSTSLAREGYPGLVEAQRRLARGLAAAIAASLQEQIAQ